MGGIPDLLFSDGDLEATLDQQRRALADAIRSIDANRVLATPVEDLVDEMVERHCANQISLHLDEMTSTGATDIALQFNDFGRSIGIGGSRVEWHLPFDGDLVLLKLRPSQYSLTPPRLEIRGSILVAAHEGQSPMHADAVRSSLDKQISDVQTYLDWQRRSIEPFNTSLPGEARAAIERRRQKVLSDRQLDAALDVPVRAHSHAARSIISAPKRRRPRPEVARRPTAPFMPEPAISDDTFGEIVEAIRAGTFLMERQAGTFRRMGEESLRDMILVSLNNQFGAPTGETFSGKGKTDIFLPVDESPGAVFIAECKIWKGPAGIGKAVDQLLGYLTWRDTKAALVVFQKSGSHDAVWGKTVRAVQEHDAYKRDRDDEGTVFTLASAADPSREIHLALVLVPILA